MEQVSMLVRRGVLTPRSGEWRLAMGGTALGVLSFAGQFLGLEPVVLHAVTIAVWLVLASRRFGVLLGSASVSVGWLSVVFIAFTLAPAVSVDARLATSVLLLVVLGSSVPLVVKVPPRELVTLDWRLAAAAGSGGLLWLAGLAWGLLSPTGGGWSWAMYRDSTMDLWEMRTMIDYNGLGSLGGITNIQPLTHAVSASLVSPRAALAASPETASAFLTGHGYHWTLSIVLTAWLAGLVAYRVALREDGRRLLPLAGAAAVSLGSVAFPLTGVALELGQINVHCILVLMLASVCAALAPREYLPLTLSVLVVALGLLSATWILFAAVPGLLAIALAWNLRGMGRTRDEILQWLLPGVAIGGWAFGIYGWPLVVESASEPSTREHLVTQSTHSHGQMWLAYSNPHSIPLSAALALITFALGLLLLGKDRLCSRVVLLTVAGLALGVVPSALAMGRFAEPLAYFPAKHLFVATWCVVPVMVGSLILVASQSRRAVAGVLTLTLGGGIFALATAHPTPSQRWTMTPWEVAQGTYFGSHDDVAGRFIEFASHDELRVPWRLDSRHDATVNLMMSSIGPDVDAFQLQPMRYVLRTYRNDFATSVACELAEADVRPLVLVTIDPLLASEVREQCPGENISVELATPKN